MEVLIVSWRELWVLCSRGTSGVISSSNSPFAVSGKSVDLSGKFFTAYLAVMTNVYGQAAGVDSDVSDFCRVVSLGSEL